jgi:hypothetical protein
MQTAERQRQSVTIPEFSLPMLKGVSTCIISMCIGSTSAPKQYASRRPPWKNINVHRNRKTGWRPWPRWIQERTMSEPSRRTVRTAAPFTGSQPPRKASEAAATMAR